MPLELLGEDVEGKSSRIVWQRDEKGEEVAFLVRPVPPSVDERLSAAVSRGLKGSQLLNQSATRLGQQLVEKTRLRAVYALVDSDGFELVTQSPEVSGEVTKAGVPIEVGQAVKLDGRWNDDLKKAVFGRVPKLAAWISNKADDLAGQDAEEEAALGKI